MMEETKHEEEPTVAWQIGIYVALMVLLCMTVGANHLELGKLALTVAIAIAAAKAILVVLYFMHVRFSSKITHVFVVAGILWMGILFSLTLSDYLTRDWLTRAGDITARTTPIHPPPGMTNKKDADELELHARYGR